MTTPSCPHALLVAAARPNFMKVAPVLAALEARGVATTLVHTGQHYDALMSDVFFDDLGIRPPDYNLEAGSGTHAAQTAAVMVAFEPLVESLEPNHVLVAGDVNSTMACALVAAKASVVVSHIEAGLRSRDWTMPEEVNRVVADRVSDLLFAPSDDAVANLKKEGYRPEQIHLVGNTMIDTLLNNLPRAMARPTLTDLGLEPRSYGVVTLHRPANVDTNDRLSSLLATLSGVAEKVPLIFPAHPRSVERIRAMTTSSRVRVIAPLGYLDFLSLQAQAALVLTDSGGLQEETTVLGVPCLTLRENTERPITVSEGTNRVVGLRPDAILEGAEDALGGRFPTRCPALWDGHAADRVADVIASVEVGSLVRPTGSQPEPTK